VVRIFPRNELANPAEYLGERPEMSSPWHAVASAKAAITRGAKEGQQRNQIN
jgi:hypothetical protein